MAGESAWESARRQREKAERLLRSAELHERGALGEEATAWALSSLPADAWTVVHDVRWPGRPFANVDHVVVGPAGVFVIDSKNWSGRITVRDHVLRQNGYKREAALVNAAEAARAVARLASAVPVDCVRPVLCFVRDEPLAEWARDVMVCSTANIVQLLATKPGVLTPEQVRDASSQLDAHLARRTTPLPAPARSRRRLVTPRPRPKARRPRRGRQHHKKSEIGRLAVAIGLVALLIFAPQVVIGFGEVVAQFLVGQASSTK